MPRVHAFQVVEADFATPEAREALAARCRPLAVRVARTASRSVEMRNVWFDDVVSEAWVGVLRAARRFDPSSNPNGLDGWGPYASTYAHQHVRKFYARHVARHGFVGFRGPPPARAGDVVPDGGVDLTASLRRVEDDPPWRGDEWPTLLKSLSAQEARVVGLCFRDQLTMREAAAATGVSVARVGAVRKKALTKLGLRRRHLATALGI